MNLQIHPNFPDLKFKSLNLTETDTLIAQLTYSNNKTLEISFTDPIQIFYKFSRKIVKIHEVIENSSFLNEAVSRLYVKVPSNHPYKMFQFINENDFPCLQVAAIAMNINKEG